MRLVVSTGEECPAGKEVFQITFLAGPNSTGRFAASNRVYTEIDKALSVSCRPTPVESPHAPAAAVHPRHFPTSIPFLPNARAGRDTKGSPGRTSFRYRRTAVPVRPTDQRTKGGSKRNAEPVSHPRLSGIWNRSLRSWM